jgi:hypothetical protein
MREIFINIEDIYIPGAVKSVIQTTIRNCNKVVLNFCPLWQFVGIDKIGSTHFHGPCFLAGISINSDDARSLNKVRGLYDTKSNGPASEDSDRRSL